MSNLLKQQFVYNEKSATRIINSNKRMEEKMKELARIYQMTEKDAQPDIIQADFVEGILAEEVPPEPQIDPNQLIAEAQAEANRILSDARDRADQMLNDANAKAQMLYEEQKTAGYNEGLARLEEEMNQRIATLNAQNEALEQELQNDYLKKLDVMENDLIDAIIEVFNKVFHIQFDGKKDILLHLVNDTLLSVESGKHFRVLVSNENWQYVDEHMEEIRLQLGSGVTIEVARDMKLSDLECRIESEFGVYDCSMDMELDSLCRDIRSLCC